MEFLDLNPTVMKPFMEPALVICEPVMNAFVTAAKASMVFDNPLINNFYLEASNASGLNEEQVRYLSGLLLAYPLSIIYGYLPGSFLKHAWSGFWGVFVAQVVLGTDWFHTAVSTVASYLLLLILPRSAAPFLVFAFMLGYLAVSHIYRIYVDYLGWRLDFTGPQMMLCIKFTCIAFNIYDGTVGKKSIDDQLAYMAGKAEPSENDKKLKNVLEGRRERALTAVPNPLVIFGFCFNYSSYLAGPAFEISEYLNVSNGKFKGEQSRPEGRFVAGLLTFLMSLGCIGTWLALSKTYDAASMHKPHITSLEIPHYIAYCWVAMFVARMKYYFAWLIGEGACQFCGFGWNGRDKASNKPQWNGVNNIDVLGVELGTSMRDYTNKWNKNTQSWLQRYVYERTNESLFVTYFVSAFWHGFYPGYYFFFLTVPLATEVTRDFFRKIRPRVVGNAVTKFIYDVLGWICTTASCNYLASSFSALSWPNTMATFTKLRFSGHITLFALFLLLKFVPSPPKSKDKSKKSN